MTSTRKALIGLLAGAALVWLTVLLPVLQRDSAEPATRGIYPLGTVVPTSYAVGLVAVRDLGGTPVAYTGQVGSHYQIYWEAVQPDLTATPDWSSAQTRVAQIQGAGLQPWLSLTLFEDSGSVAATATDSLHVPTAAPTIAYGSGVCADRAPDYNDPTFRAAYSAAVARLVTAFDDDVAGYILELGADGETINVKNNGACANQTAYEQQVPCAQYWEWLKYATRTWRAATAKPLYVQPVAACAGSATWSSSRDIMEYSYPPTATAGPAPVGNAPLTPTPLWLGYKSNAMAPDRSDAWGYNSVAPWGIVQPGAQWRQIGGAAFEPGQPISVVPTAERVGYAGYMAYNAIANGADNLFYQPEWLPYLDSSAMYAITMTLGMDATDSPAVWIVPRSAEYQRTGPYAYSFSGYPGAFEHLAEVKAAVTPTPVCQPSTYATAQASGSGGYRDNPVICSGQLTTPQAPESRNTWYWPANSSIGIDVDDAWLYGQSGVGAGDYTARITYLDTGTDTWSLVHRTASGYVTDTVTKTNTLAWVTANITLTNALLSDGMPTGGDVELRTGTGGEYYHRIWLEWAGGTAPTATPTRTPTATRTPVPTATPTGTWQTATNTPTQVASTQGHEGTGESVSLYRAAPSTNYNGQYVDYLTWQNKQVERNMLLRWPDLAQPAGYTFTGVVSATLSFYVQSQQGADLRVRMYEMQRDWDADKVTWQQDGIGVNWQSGGGTNWQSGGAMGVQDRGTQVLTFVLQPGLNSIDVTESVRRWMATGGANYGWLLVPVNPCPLESCTVWAGIASDRFQDTSLRPALSVGWQLSSAPTATTAPSSTPTHPATPAGAYTVTPGPTSTAGGPTVTPTPTPVPGLKLNEFCLDPISDANLDGYTNIRDRAIELYNPGSTAIDLADYRLQFCNPDCNHGHTFILPRNSRIDAGGYKVIYGESLRNLADEPFDMPGGIETVNVVLRDPDGVWLDGMNANWAGSGRCWARWPNGTNNWWTGMLPTLGRRNDGQR